MPALKGAVGVTVFIIKYINPQLQPKIYFLFPLKKQKNKKILKKIHMQHFSLEWIGMEKALCVCVLPANTWSPRVGSVLRARLSSSRVGESRQLAWKTDRKSLTFDSWRVYTSKGLLRRHRKTRLTCSPFKKPRSIEEAPAQRKETPDDTHAPLNYQNDAFWQERDVNLRCSAMKTTPSQSADPPGIYDRYGVMHMLWTCILLQVNPERSQSIIPLRSQVAFNTVAFFPTSIAVRL